MSGFQHSNFTQQWQLTLNQSKCKAMRITNKLMKIDYTYSLNVVSLKVVNTFRYLGVRINGKLTWTDQVSEAKTKATRMLNLLRRSMEGCSKQAKAWAYTALVRPPLETCAPVWTPYQKGAQDDLAKACRQMDMLEVGQSESLLVQNIIMRNVGPS